MGKLIKAAVLSVILLAVGLYIVISNFAPGETPEEQVDAARGEVDKFVRMARHAVPQAAPDAEGAGLGEILDAATRPEEAAPPQEVEVTVENGGRDAAATRPSAVTPTAPREAGPPEIAPPPPPPPAPDRVHEVAPGETLSNIARKHFDTSTAAETALAVKRIVEANPGMNPDRILVGQKIRIPGGTQDAPAMTADAEPVEAEAPASTRIYEVRPGDTLYSIAERELGDGSLYKAIARANPGIDPDRLAVGAKLTLPKGDGRR